MSLHAQLFKVLCRQVLYSLSKLMNSGAVNLPLINDELPVKVNIYGYEGLL